MAKDQPVRGLIARGDMQWATDLATEGLVVGTHEIEPSVDHCERIRRSAGRSLLLVAVLDAAHVLVAFFSASPEKLTAPTLVGGIALNIALIWVLVWAGKGVMRGVRIAAALGILGFVGLGLTVALSMALANGYDAPLGLAIVQILLLVSVFISLFLVVRLWLSTVQGKFEE